MALLNLANYNLSYPVITPEIRKEIQENTAEILTLTQHTTLNQGIQAGALGILSNLASRDKNDALSEQYLLKAEQILLTQKPVYYHVMINVVQDLAQLYAKQNNYRKAFEYQSKVTDYSNKLFDEGQAETAKDWKPSFSHSGKNPNSGRLQKKQPA